MTTSAPVVAFRQDVTPEVVVADAKVDTMALTASLTAAISWDEETSQYVSYCIALQVYSMGKTKEEAEENILEATELFVESCFEHGTLYRVLKKLGINVTNGESHQKLPQQESRSYYPEIYRFRYSVKIPLAEHT